MLIELILLQTSSTTGRGRDEEGGEDGEDEEAASQDCLLLTIHYYIITLCNSDIQSESKRNRYIVATGYICPCTYLCIFAECYIM